jgi:hypothetical protein
MIKFGRWMDRIGRDLAVRVGVEVEVEVEGLE